MSSFPCCELFQSIMLQYFDDTKGEEWIQKCIINAETHSHATFALFFSTTNGRFIVGLFNTINAYIKAVFPQMIHLFSHSSFIHNNKCHGIIQKLHITSFLRNKYIHLFIHNTLTFHQRTYDSLLKDQRLLHTRKKHRFHCSYMILFLLSRMKTQKFIR